LTISGNTQVGEAEADIICISNYSTNIGLNIYAEVSNVTSTTLPKIQIYNDGTPTLFNTNINIADNVAYSFTDLSSSTYVPNINFLYNSLTTLVVNQNTAVPTSQTITFSISPSYSVTYSTAFYNTALCDSAKATFTLSTTGRATFSFSPQSPSPNTYNNNNAYCQLTTPTWSNGTADENMQNYFNGASNPFLLGIWNSLTILNLPTFPFYISSTEINQYGASMYSSVLSYPTDTSYFQTYTAQVSCFLDATGGQNLALYVYPPLNGITTSLAVQILPFTFSFG
jgi:hypothetical protein